MENLTLTPFNETITASAGETITRTTTITNNGSEIITGLTYKLTPYSETRDYYDDYSNPQFDTPWHYYNDIVNWTTITNSAATLAPGESADINYTINIPSCSPSDYQWMALTVEGSSNTESGIALAMRMAERISVTIENNEASECGGTADDPYPYIEVKRIEGDGTISTFEVPYDSNAVAIYEDKKEQIEQTEANITAQNQTISTATDNLPLIIGLTIGAIVVATLIIVLVKALTKKKSGPNPPVQTPPTQTPPTQPEAPANPRQ